MTSPLRLHWLPQHTPLALQAALVRLGEEYPIDDAPRAGSREVRFVPEHEADTVRVERDAAHVVIHYGELAQALRAVGALLAGGAGQQGEAVERTPFRTRGIMLDCSRNAVMTVAYFKGWLRRLALHGYNLAMLYTEETYALPGEPYFGYLRGAYSEAELREIDEYAAALGIEMVPCIQMLGHLNALLKWPAYAEAKDTAGVLLAGAEATYDLLGKMLDHWARVFRTRRIHIGMDEAHDLGSGRYMDRNGYRPPFEIFSEHLARCQELCRARGFKPMIWSDMYFRMGSRERLYYDEACHIPREVLERYPREVDLCYWDYYHDQAEFYTRWIDKHREFGVEPLMVSGVWTWMRFWYDRRTTEANVTPCIEATRAAGLKEIVFTLWHDDGAYCDIDSAWVGLAFAAEQLFDGAGAWPGLEQRYAAVHGVDYASRCQPCAINDPPLDPAVGWNTPLALWDDPLLGIYLQNLRIRVPAGLRVVEQHYHELATALGAQPGGPERAGAIGTAALLARIVAVKVGLAHRLIAAYGVRDLIMLEQCAGEAATLQELLRQLATAWRAQWMSRHKPFGFDVLQRRLAGLQARYEELARRIGELLRGEIESIPELDGNLPAAPGGVLDFAFYHQVAAAAGL